MSHVGRPRRVVRSRPLDPSFVRSGGALCFSTAFRVRRRPRKVRRAPPKWWAGARSVSWSHSTGDPAETEHRPCGRLRSPLATCGRATNRERHGATRRSPARNPNPTFLRRTAVAHRATRHRRRHSTPSTTANSCNEPTSPPCADAPRDTTAARASRAGPPQRPWWSGTGTAIPRPSSRSGGNELWLQKACDRFRSCSEVNSWKTPVGMRS